MTPAADVVIDPHVVIAILAVVIALFVCLLLFLMPIEDDPLRRKARRDANRRRDGL